MMRRKDNVKIKTIPGAGGGGGEDGTQDYECLLVSVMSFPPHRRFETL